MKTVLLCAALLLVSTCPGFSQKTALPEVSFSKIPANTDEFLNLRNELAKSPEGGAAVFVVAMLIYAQDPALGRQCLIIASDKSLLRASGNSGYKGFDFGANSDYLIKQMDNKKYMANSYIQGTSVNNAYALGKPPYRIRCFANPYSGKAEDGQIKVFVNCTGASSDRPITLLRNEQGIWKAKEFSSLVVGIQAPKQKSQGAAEGDF
jgi:hypothetical protein